MIEEIERFLHEKIPASKALGMRVADIDAKGVSVSAPLAANINHQGTMFGGSINMLTTLAGYVLLWHYLLTQELDAYIVIKQSRISFYRPVVKDATATCLFPDEKTLAVFHRSLREKGRARLTLTVTIEQDAVTVVEFEGEFVAISR